MTRPLTEDDLEPLRHEWAGLTGAALIRKALETFPGQVAALTSAGVDAGITLSAVAQVDPNMPVLFGDTHKHFSQTLAYRHTLQGKYGLTNIISPPLDAQLLEHFDPDGELNATDKSLCCGIRKVTPLEDYLTQNHIRVLIGGRMRWQSKDREDIQLLEWDPYKNVLMLNPFALLTRSEAEAIKADAPKHPLLEKGYTSVGCEPCTSPAKAGEESARSGRVFGSTGKGDESCGLNASDGASQNWRSEIYRHRRDQRPDVGL